jgi:hypothetical protein
MRAHVRERLSGMWVQLATWIVGDDGLELGEGDRWRTVLEVSLGDAEVVDADSPLGFELVGDPLSVVGASYNILARVHSAETTGSFLDAGGVTLTPNTLVGWSAGAVLAFRSELRGGWYPFAPPPDHLIFEGEVRRLFIRQWDAVPDGASNSWRADPQTLRTHAIQRIQMWETANDLDGPDKKISDYLLELT